jgi:hypothetical protein
VAEFVLAFPKLSTRKKGATDPRQGLNSKAGKAARRRSAYFFMATNACNRLTSRFASGAFSNFTTADRASRSRMFGLTCHSSLDRSDNRQ